MPVLGFPRNVENSHPVVDELGSDGLCVALGGPRSLTEPCSRVLLVDVNGNLFNVLVGQAGKDTLGVVPREDHGLHIGEDFFRGPFARSEVGLLTNLLPF